MQPIIRLSAKPVQNTRAAGTFFKLTIKLCNLKQCVCLIRKSLFQKLETGLQIDASVLAVTIYNRCT
jgi:hypothetical protein